MGRPISARAQALVLAAVFSAVALSRTGLLPTFVAAPASHEATRRVGAAFPDIATQPSVPSVSAPAAPAAALALAGLVASALAARAGARKGRRGAAAREVSVERCAVFEPADIPGTLSAPPATLAFSGASAAALPSLIGAPAGREESAVKMYMLMPKAVKWRKPRKPLVKHYHANNFKPRGWNEEHTKPIYGRYAIVAMTDTWANAKCMEECRRCLVRTMERKGKVYRNIFPNMAITKRVAEARMGAGKGNIDRWVAVVRPHTILWEIDGVSELIARQAFWNLSHTWPGKTKFIKKDDGPSRFELGLEGVAFKVLTQEEKDKLRAENEARKAALRAASGGKKKK